MPKTAFVFCGGSRTFLECFDTCFQNVIHRLCPDLSKVTLIFYMKLTDPGPKKFAAYNVYVGKYTNCNFEYRDNNYNETIQKIEEYRTRGLQIFHRILFHSEINDFDLMLSVRSRGLYIGFNSRDNQFIRAVHQAYNFEKGGQMLLDAEGAQGFEFDAIVYIRPDLLFTGESKELGHYLLDKVILAEGDEFYSNDHFALIPRKYMKKFFFDRMELYRTNTDKKFTTAEEVYWHTIDYRVEKIAPYHIERQAQIWDLWG